MLSSFASLHFRKIVNPLKLFRDFFLVVNIKYSMNRLLFRRDGEEIVSGVPHVGSHGRHHGRQRAWEDDISIRFATWSFYTIEQSLYIIII